MVNTYAILDDRRASRLTIFNELFVEEVFVQSAIHAIRARASILYKLLYHLADSLLMKSYIPGSATLIEAQAVIIVYRENRKSICKQSISAATSNLSVKIYMYHWIDLREYLDCLLLITARIFQPLWTVLLFKTLDRIFNNRSFFLVAGRRSIDLNQRIHQIAASTPLV